MDQWHPSASLAPTLTPFCAGFSSLSCPYSRSGLFIIRSYVRETMLSCLMHYHVLSRFGVLLGIGTPPIGGVILSSRCLLPPALWGRCSLELRCGAPGLRLAQLVFGRSEFIVASQSDW